MKKLVVLLIAAALTGCAQIEPKQFVGPNKGVAYTMECSGQGRTLDACYKKAGEVCPDGYTLIEQRSETAGFMPLGGMFVPLARQHLAIECK